jgi:hypothetical protein
MLRIVKRVHNERAGSRNRLPDNPSYLFSYGPPNAPLFRVAKL